MILRGGKKIKSCYVSDLECGFSAPRHSKRTGMIHTLNMLLCCNTVREKSRKCITAAKNY